MRKSIFAGAFLAILLALSFVLVAADNTGTISGTVNAGIARKYPTVVYIDEVPGQKFATPAKMNMDQKAKVFLPRVLPLLAGTAVEFLNSDPFVHNVFSPDGEKYDLGNWDKGEKRSYTFKHPGVYTQLCKLHPDMIAYIVVLKNPYFALVDDQGKFKIAGAPVGNWTLKVWNERLKPNQLNKTFSVVVAAGQDAKIDITP